MNIRTSFKTRLSALAVAVAASASMALPTHAQAQTQTQTRYASTTTTSISSFDVEPLDRLRPGEVLSFALRATPGATAMLTIDGAAAPVTLTEVRPGAYEGSYTIRQTDRLSERSRVTARVLRNGRAATALLSTSLLAGAPDVAFVSTNSISEFKVTAPDRVRPGEELNFAVTGTPGGKARVAIDGIGTAVPLREVSRGEYEGSYVVRRKDRLRGSLTANAYLVNGGRESSQRYERVVVADDNRNGERRDDRNQQQASCPNCGTVESVKVVEARNDNSNVLGTIAGGVLGGVIGNQVGGGSGKDAARIIGAIGGAYAGNRTQNNMGKDKLYRVTVRMQGGTTQDFDYAQDPQVTVGTRVRVEGDVLVRR